MKKGEALKIKIRLFATLRHYAPNGEGSEFEIIHQGNLKVSNLYKLLEIPNTIDAVILLNGRHADSETIMSNGDEIVLYPTIAGG